MALCHGWIDGQVARCDEQYYLQLFTPRRARSKWSKINRIKVKALIESGRMQPAGLREVGAAQRDGRWEAAYDSPSTATVPPDFAARLDASPTAARAFAGLKSMERYSMLYQLQDAKRPETRAKRIEKFMGVLEEPGVN